MNTDSLFWVKGMKELFHTINCADIFQNNVKIINLRNLKNMHKANYCHVTVQFGMRP